MERAWQATLLDLQRHVDEAFDRLVFRPWSVAPRPCWLPLVDLYEMADSYLVEIDLPGIAPEDVQVVVEERGVTLSGHREAAAPDGVLQCRYERPVGPFQRSLTFPHPIVPGEATAEYRRGTCRLRLPKARGGEARATPVPCVIRIAVP